MASAASAWGKSITTQAPTMKRRRGATPLRAPTRESWGPSPLKKFFTRARAYGVLEQAEEEGVEARLLCRKLRCCHGFSIPVSLRFARDRTTFRQSKAR